MPKEIPRFCVSVYSNSIQKSFVLRNVTWCNSESGAKTNKSQITVRLTALISEWFNKESNWFLYTVTIYQHLLLFCCQPIVIILEKEKESVELVMQMLKGKWRDSTRRMPQKMLLCSHVYWHLFPKVKGQNDQSQLNSGVQNVSWQTT